MLVNKFIMAAVLLSILLSLFSSGLISAAFDLSAFSLLLFYLYSNNRHSSLIKRPK
ncbi:hypothetical protein [Psychromonas ossibalaenae]|uniref:hypothetical protein n=1 Tax=Psychromonas ossibalaenae TaxID=444922 RepID=UPI0003730078|nr:hypothetical protein [Psychromonas ossibalaenae]